jgi:hypothetical protein
MLPSYPDILAQVIENAAPVVGAVDHLVSASSAMPLGVGLSLKTGLPLVYSRGINDAPAFDLVGAYDIGHPALLLANDLSDEVGLLKLLTSARLVGLEIERLLVIADDGTPGPYSIPVISLLHLPTAVEKLVEGGQLPVGHGEAVESWLRAQDRINPHPG